MNEETIKRLATVGEPGASLYNSYHFLTQIAGLYAQVAQYDLRTDSRSTWVDLSDSILLDLGSVYSIWEAALKREPPLAPMAIDQRVFSTCVRSQKFVDLLGIWTPMSTWCRVLLRLERRWASFIANFSAEDLHLKDGFKPLVHRAKARLALVEEVQARFEEEAKRLNENHPSSFIIAEEA